MEQENNPGARGKIKKEREHRKIKKEQRKR